MLTTVNGVPMKTQAPAVELVDLLRSAYDPCPEFTGDCRDVARWAPHEGHVPRGYFGAHGTLDEVEVILLLAEPGDPFEGDTFPLDMDATAIIGRVSTNTSRNYGGSCECIRQPCFHANMRKILNLLVPDKHLSKQLRKVWISETYLCSAPNEGGGVPAVAERACARKFLLRQLSLLPDLPVVALGGKAQKRIRRLLSDVPGLEHRLIDAWAASPPGANSPKARQSWVLAADQVRAFRREMTKQSAHC